jgi:hypothetical protein
MDSGIKAYCPKCFMTFEAGKKSTRAIKHAKLAACDKIPCSRTGADCIRKFASVNSANRHTHCYSQTQVDQWCEDLKLTFDLNIDFESLKISDAEQARTEKDTNLQTDRSEGIENLRFKYKNELTVSEVFEILKKKIGNKGKEINLEVVREGFITMGYTSAEVIRAAHRNQGSWKFVTKGFRYLSEDIVRIAIALKKILNKKTLKKSGINN